MLAGHKEYVWPRYGLAQAIQSPDQQQCQIPRGSLQSAHDHGKTQLHKAEFYSIIVTN